jgi:tRNA (cmo5U34)-methyltransferase
MSNNERFSFSSTAHEFDEHIGKSIRGYHDLREDIVGMSRYFVEDDTNVIDIGCSQGTMLRQIRDSNTQAPNATYIGIEANDAFRHHWQEESNLHFRIEDVRQSDALSNMSLAISMFTFQFLPERSRLSLMRRIYDELVEGGAFITTEKVFSQNAKTQNMLEFLYYDFKRKSFSEKEILDKEQELRHLAKNTTEKMLDRQLRSIGFRGVQCFWRNFNFIGVLAMKKPREAVADSDDI